MLTCQQLGVFLVDQVGEVSTIIQDHVEGLTVLEVNGLFNAPHILFVRLTLPCVHYRDRQTHTSILKVTISPPAGHELQLQATYSENTGVAL